MTDYIPTCGSPLTHFRTSAVVLATCMLAACSFKVKDVEEFQFAADTASGDGPVHQDTTVDTAPDTPAADTPLDSGQSETDQPDVVAPDVCTPSCEEAECGSDGCKGSCGECPAGDTCSPDRKCVPAACESDLECEQFGMVCKLDDKVCVHCLESDQCDESSYCLDNSCVPDECNSGDRKCVDQRFSQCAEDGSGWSEAQECPGEHYCNDGQCLPWVCQPKTVFCEENDVAQCNESGSASETLKQCGDESVCVGEECEEKVCQPGISECVAKDLIHECVPPGLSWGEETPCPDGNWCNPEKQACVPWVCEPLSKECEGTQGLAVCDEFGSQAQFQPCPENHVCDQDACAQLVCEPNVSSCLGEFMVELCNGLGTAFADHFECEEGKYCEPAQGQCVDQQCVPESVTCLDLHTMGVCNWVGAELESVGCPEATVCLGEECVPVICEAQEEKTCKDAMHYQTCNEWGTGWGPGEPCESGTYCKDGKCAPQMCTPGETICFNEDAYQVCDDSGSDWGEPVMCGSNKVCLEGECEQQECEPGKLGCEGTDVGLCNELGTKYDVVEKCDPQQPCLNGQCDPPQYHLWAKSFGDSGPDYLRAMVADKDGNVYAAGFFASSNNGSDINPSEGGDDILVVKLSDSGNVVWTKTFGGAKDDMAYDLDIDSVGNVYVVGEFKSPQITFGNVSIANGGISSSDIFVLKLNANGTPAWAHAFGGGKTDVGLSIVVDNSDYIWFTGFFSTASMSFGCDDKTLSNLGGTDAFLAKLNTAGTCQNAWSPAMSDGNEQGIDLAVDDKNRVHLTGSFDGKGLWWLGGSMLENTNQGTEDVFTTRFGAGSGTANWATSLGGAGNDKSCSIAIDPTDRAYVVGEFTSQSISIGNDSWTNAGAGVFTPLADVFLVKFSTAGEPEWSKAFGGVGTDRAESVSLDVSGNSYIAGSFNSMSLNLGGALLWGSADGITGKEIFIGRFKPNGEHVWSQSFGSKGDDLAYEIVAHTDSIFYLGGHSNSEALDFGGGSLPNAGDYDIFVARRGQ